MIDLCPMPVGLYIHLPFCVHRCVYCDFTVKLFQHKTVLKKYLDAVISEISLKNEEFPFSVDSIYMGGGTPSLYDAADIDFLLRSIANEVEGVPHSEITLEANPNSLTADKLEGYLKAGVNRLSLGIQSFQEKYLKTLERIHSPQEAKEAIINAQKVGFKNINLDFIFGIPEQNLRDYQADLKQAVQFSPTHISTYHLTVNQKNPLYPHLSSDLLTKDMYLWGIHYLSKAGFLHVEVSAFSKRGYESRHNLKYWMSDDFLGVGVGAYSRMRTQEAPWGLHLKNTTDLDFYLSHALSRQDVALERETVTQLQAEKDFLITNLRRLKGFSDDEFKKRFKKSLVKSNSYNISSLVERGLIDFDEKMLKLTAKGLLFLNQVLVELV